MKTINSKLKNKYKNVIVNNIDNIPSTGVNIFIPNHQTIMDIFLVPYAIKTNCISIVSANSTFCPTNERKEKLYELLNVFPMEVRAGKYYTDVCIKYLKKLIKNNNDIVIFSQGVFDASNTISKARTGIIRIINDVLQEKKMKINIIPVAIQTNANDEQVFLCNPWDDMKATITFLKPYNYQSELEKLNLLDNEIEKNVIYHNIMDNIMNNIAKELNREFVNKYNQLYYMDGFYFPNTKYIKFIDSNKEELYEEYDEGLNQIYNKIIKDNRK